MRSYDEHFLRDVLALGDERPVVTTTAIFSQNRIKLVDAGARVTSALYERLVCHKLLPPIERSLKAEGGVDAADLAQRAGNLLADDARFARIGQFVPRGTVCSAFRHVLLPPPLAFKLTVARERRPQLFAHSVEAALLAVYLKGMSSRRISDLALAATAGLLQDIGLLHIPPDVLAPGKPLSESDRRYLYTHPITAQLIVREFPELHPVASAAILEHHERLDGSGYPHGLRGAAISELGKILMMADSGAALLKTGALGQGGIALRLLQRKFSAPLLGHLSRLFAPLTGPQDGGAVQTQDLALRQLKALAEILLEWGRAYACLHAENPACRDDAFLDLVNRRITALERSLVESGFVAGQLETFTAAAAQDASGAQEMRELAREALWQLKDVTLEVRRRWADAAQPNAVHQTIARWLSGTDERLGAI